MICGAGMFFFYPQRMVGAWNTLPVVVMEAGTIVAFPRLLDRHIDMQRMERYGSHEAK